jgi:hypothetical protein
MAFAHARSIVVDGVRYSWKVTVERSWARSPLPIPVMKVAVQSARGTGQKLFANVPGYPDGAAALPPPMRSASGATIQEIPKQTVTITPAFVARLVRLARSKGWHPDAKGPPLHIDAASEESLSTHLPSIRSHPER